MKLSSILTLLLLTAMPALAEFRVWTNSEGQEAELELRSVKEVNGEKVGLFGMKSGKAVRLKSSQLSPEDAKILQTWKPTGPSVFGEILNDNLVILKNGRFEAVDDQPAPKKYYVFYYTAYWCPPCRSFTPSLVQWYNKNKNDNFELVLITSDNDKSDMLKYAKDKKMPWPQLKFSKAKSFKNKFNHGVSGIPSLIVCDLKGKVLGNYRSSLDSLTTLVK